MSNKKTTASHFVTFQDNERRDIVRMAPRPVEPVELITIEFMIFFGLACAIVATIF